MYNSSGNVYVSLREVSLLLKNSWDECENSERDIRHSCWFNMIFCLHFIFPVVGLGEDLLKTVSVTFALPS